MKLEEIVHKAMEHGLNVGQISLAEFILKSYGHELSPDLKKFLQKICDNGYMGIAETVGKPAEDIALEVSKVMKKVG